MPEKSLNKAIIPKFVSLYDLALNKIFVDVKTTSNSIFYISEVVDMDTGRAIELSEFNKILHKLGVDVNKKYQITEVVQHRACDNSVVKGHRIEGKERTDRKWIQSGYASQEVYYGSSKFPDMRDLASVKRAIG